MKVLVTGGTGYLGRAVVRALGVARPRPGRLRADRVAQRTARRARRRRHPRSERARARRRRLRRDLAFGRARQHLATPARGLRRRQRRRAAQRAGRRGNAARPRVLYTSSFLALPPRDIVERGEPIEANDYQRTKVAADRVADEAVRDGSPLIRVYPGVVYGPGTFTEGNLIGRLIADHLKGRLPGLVGPENPWSYAYVDDVAAGHCAALERGAIGARYALGGENAPQLRVFDLVRQITGRRPPRRIPFRCRRPHSAPPRNCA